MEELFKKERKIEWDEVRNFYDSVIATVLQFCSQIKEVKAVKGRASKTAVQGQQNTSFSIGSTIFSPFSHVSCRYYNSHSNPWDVWDNDSYAESKILGHL